MKAEKRAVWLMAALAVLLFSYSDEVYAETQTINANLAIQSDKWGESPQNSIPCMQTYAPYAKMLFDVIVPEPGGPYEVSLSLVKVTNGAHLRVYIDNELQTEVDTFAPANVRETILVCKRFFAAGKHTIKIKNVGQKKATGGNHLSVIGFDIVDLARRGKWRMATAADFAFTPLKKEDPSEYGDLLPIDLPPRLQEQPFSIPQGGNAADIFSHPLVSVNSIPFRIPNVDDVPETGFLIEEQKPLEIGLPDTARELFLLIWSKIPPVDTDSGPPRKPIAPIDQSERFTAEIVHEDGTSDHVIPFNVVKKCYGLDNGLSLYVLHPGPGKVPRRLIFHDKVYKCSFALVALTCNPDEPVSPEPGPEETSAWYPAVDKRFPAVTRKVESRAEENSARVSDGIIAAEVGLTNGVQWSRLGSPAYGEVTLDKSPVFAVRHTDDWIGSEKWKVVERKASDEEVSVALAYKEGAVDLTASVKFALAGDGKIKVGLTLVNEGSEPFLGRVRFPILEGLRLGSLSDTWYFFPESGGAAMIHHTEANVYGSHGAAHPLQVDSFFNPKEWYALTLLSNDLEGQFRWYDVGKSEEGGWYRLEYLERLLKPGATWSFPDCIIAISPGDWRESFRLYRDWVGTWYKPKPPAQEWYKKSFLLGFWYVYAGLDNLVAGAQNARDLFGYCDVMSLYGWNAREHKENPTHQRPYSGDSGPGRHGYSGEYDRDALWLAGGEENLKSSINKANRAGVPISLYTNPVLINKEAYRFGEKSDEWGMGDYPCDHTSNPRGYVPCLSSKEWLDYMVDCSKYLTQDIGAKIIYLDQAGSGSRICYSKKHTHESPEPHFYGERELTRRIREAVPDDAVICSEAHPEDTRLQFQNGFYQGGILLGFTREISVPMNMTRFAFPDIKCFNNIYGYVLKDNNWEFLKFVLFSGDAYCSARLAHDPKSWVSKESTQVLRKLFRILHENADAFTSLDVEPLIPTLIPGVFVNRFKGDEKVIWTVFNANYRTVKGKLLEIAGKPGSRYVDLWNDAPVNIKTTGKTASLMVEIGPRDVACISEVPE